MKNFCASVFTLFVFGAFAQGTYQVRIMTWNLLNYPSTGDVAADTALRDPFYRTVVQYVNPDVLITQENTSDSSTAWFLQRVLNAGGTTSFQAGTFINGYDSDNGIFFRASSFQFISNTPIHTGLRDINEFSLVHQATGDTLRIYSCHLKASQGSANASERAREADSLRKITNALPAGTDFLACGDFNFYDSSEPAYVVLLDNDGADDGEFHDAFIMPGIWNQAVYSPYHTQSTRTRSFGGGITGGLDDRFDLILYSSAVSLPGKITYLPGSMTAVGNDGQHFNDSINRIPNAAVPQAVADALHGASDHLPVYADFEFAALNAVEDLRAALLKAVVFPNPSSGSVELTVFMRKPSPVGFCIYDMAGALLREFPEENPAAAGYTIHLFNKGELKPGIYLLRVHAGTQFYHTPVVVAE